MNDFFYDLDNLDGSWGSDGFFNPKNLTEEQIKQLQEHLGVTADGKFGPQTTRALQEKLGVKADGKWGNVSSNAWNDAYWNEVEERNKHNSAKAAGVENPYVENVVDYVPQYEDVQEQALVQEKARQENIAKLESQIAQVEERIARNKRALTGKSYEDVNNKLAKLELDKIGFRFNGQPTNTDPTSFWRWNQARQDTKEANDLRNAEAKNKFANTVDMWVKTRPAPTTEGIMQQISNINSAIRDGKNAGADVSRLEDKKNELEALVYGDENPGSSGNYGAGTETEQNAGLLETVLATAKTSDELIKFRNGYKWKPEQLTKLDTKIAELKKKEKANADEREFREWVEKQTGKKFSAFSKRVLDTYRKVWKNTRGK